MTEIIQAASAYCKVFHWARVIAFLNVKGSDFDLIIKRIGIKIIDVNYHANSAGDIMLYRICKTPSKGKSYFFLQKK